MPYLGLRDFHRTDEIITAPHAALARLEVWSTRYGSGFSGLGAGLLHNDAEHVSFTVDDKWVTGVRRSLSLTVPQTAQWKDWLGRPDLLLRPFVGVVTDTATTVEWMPLGVFSVQQRPWSLDLVSGGVQVRGSDQYSRVVGAESPAPWGYGGEVREVITQLLRYTNTFQFRVSVTASSGAMAAPIAPTKKRHELIKDLAASIGAEVFTDRDGVFYVQDRKYRPADTTLRTGEGGTVIDVVETLDRSGVRNIVRAETSNTGVSFPPVAVYVADINDPAHPVNLGGWYDETITSPLFLTPEQAFQAATARLAKVKETARTLSISCVPNYRLNAGDGINLQWPDGLVEYLAVRTITYPHPEDDTPQVITAVTSMGPDDE